MSGTRILDQGASYRTWRSHGKFHPGIAMVESLLHQTGKHSARTYDHRAFFFVELPRPKFSGQCDNYARIPFVRHEKVRPLAGDKPRKLLVGAHFQHSGQSGYAIHLGVRMSRPTDTVGGMASHRLVEPYFSLELIVETKELQLRGMASSHYLRLFSRSCNAAKSSGPTEVTSPAPIVMIKSPG